MRLRPHLASLTLASLFVWGCSSAPKKAYVPPAPTQPSAQKVEPATMPVTRIPVTPNYADLPSQPKFDPVLDVIQTAEAAFERGRKS